MEFYARQALRFAAPQPLTQSPNQDEVNEVFYIPLGAGIVIPPWNFPLAILAGMAAAAIVSGNTVVLKPSSDTPIIAAKFCELMESIGLACRRPEFPAVQRRRSRRFFSRASEDQIYFVHRINGSRLAHQ